MKLSSSCRSSDLPISALLPFCAGARKAKLTIRILPRLSRSRRDMDNTCSICIASLCASRPHHGAQNSCVRTAFTEVASQTLLHLIQRRLGRLGEQRLSGHDHSICTIPALRGLFRDEGG